MEFNFTKYQGCGNDFVFIDGYKYKNIDELIALSPKICDRNFGIGGDGVIFILPSETADFRMRIINNDGSEAEMCGNGIRCFAKAVQDLGLTKANKFTVETGAGIIIPEILEDGRVKVDMGEPVLASEEIPVAGIGSDKVVAEKITVDGREYKVTCVSMGNPHCVIFVDDIKQVDLVGEGSKLEVAKYFPRKINVEFVEVKSPSAMRMRVWERGTGITLACGTGTCASHVAAVLNGLVEKTTTVELDGGKLEVQWADDNHIYMTGPGEKVFTGTWLAK